MRVLVTGAGGLLGREVVRQLSERGHEAVACDRRALDITDAARARAVVEREQPQAIVHCAAFTNVDAAESDPDSAQRVNADGTANVARAAAHVSARFLYVSTDYVFDGSSTVPYTPDARPNPLSVYGRTKLEGEQAARLAGDALITRTSWVYGRGGSNFASGLLDRARAGQTVRAIDDQRSVPTWVRDAADALIRLLEHAAPPGTYHASNRGSATWYEFAQETLACAGVAAAVEAVRLEQLALPAPRPRYSVLDVTATERVAGGIRCWKDAVAAAVRDGL